MRRRIRLTGRKQLPHSSVGVEIFDANDPEKKLISLSLLNQKLFQSFPGTARIKLRLFESKFFETLEFGTLDEQKPTAYLKNIAFSAPTCQLRIVGSDDDNKGLLLGSTKTWTLRKGNEDEKGARKGILMFKHKNISPRIWKLDTRDDDYPVVYIDQKIVNPGAWARNDPVFTSCVLPAIIREVFEEILDSEESPEQEWIQDWLAWADHIMHNKPPPFSDENVRKQQWIEDLLDNFCHKHRMLDMLLDDLKRDA